ncbi:fimbria/pilus periplasmic chaperone [Proteus mirabilis]|uniref:fimbria/pilus periplasmic chaperone n=1 Tax=Proteus mirabilis TaxID=584 RepID=UPI0020C593F8|nr:fimbria/pilus periplasmic chaperone [Proteus mirabilis]
MKYNVYILFIIILCSIFFTQANVIYSGTRFIYNEDDNDIIINIKKKNSATDYLIQSWITKDEKNDKKYTFYDYPPLFKLNKEQSAILNCKKSHQ